MAAQQPNISTIRTSTQFHLDIHEITEDIVILKDGSGCLVCSATAINFSLLSEEEQEATIYAYAAILNSLTYPIQILIHSERKDISDYLKHIKILEDTQSNKKLKEHIRRYRRFVEETVQRNNVLDKSFYIIIPFTALELGASQALFSQFSSQSNKLPFPLSYIIDKAINHLHPKRDHLIRQFMRLGIRLQQLTTPELIELFYHAYNPDLSRGAKLDISKSYAAPLVQGPTQMNSKLSQKIDEFNNSNTTTFNTNINKKDIEPETLPTTSPPAESSPNPPNVSMSPTPTPNQPYPTSPQPQSSTSYQNIPTPSSLMPNSPSPKTTNDTSPDPSTTPDTGMSEPPTQTPVNPQTPNPQSQNQIQTEDIFNQDQPTKLDIN